MRFCKQCRKVSPSASLYCIGCGGAFKGKRCAKGHLAPHFALACPECGSTELSAYASSVQLGWLPPTVSVALIALGLWLVHSLFSNSRITVGIPDLADGPTGARDRTWLLMNIILGDLIIFTLFCLVVYVSLGKYRSIFTPLFRFLVWIVRTVIGLAKVLLDGLESLLQLSKKKEKGH